MASRGNDLCNGAHDQRVCSELLCGISRIVECIERGEIQGSSWMVWLVRGRRGGSVRQLGGIGGGWWKVWVLCVDALDVVYGVTDDGVEGAEVSEGHG